MVAVCWKKRKGVFVCISVWGVVSLLGNMKGKLSGVQQSVWVVAQERALKPPAGRLEVLRLRSKAHCLI